MTRYLRYALPALAGVLLVGLLVFMATAPHGKATSAVSHEAPTVGHKHYSAEESRDHDHGEDAPHGYAWNGYEFVEVPEPLPGCELAAWGTNPEGTESLAWDSCPGDEVPRKRYLGASDRHKSGS